MRDCKFDFAKLKQTYMHSRSRSGIRSRSRRGSGRRRSRGRSQSRGLPARPTGVPSVILGHLDLAQAPMPLLLMRQPALQ